MPTTIEFRFPWGRYHATPWNRTVNEADVEWPPSPWRICRMLLSVWFERCPDIPERHVEEILGVVGAPPDYHVPNYALAHTRHYFPDSATGQDLVLDPFVAVGRDASLHAGWEGDLSPEAQGSLGRLLDNVSYLGRADSMCEASLGDLPPDIEWNVHRDVVSPGGSAIDLLVPERPVTIEALTVRSAFVRDKLRLTDPPGARLTRYQRPSPSNPRTSRSMRPPMRPDAIRLRIARAVRPPMGVAILYAHVARQAAMSRYEKLTSRQSPTLSGRGVDSDGRVLLDDHGHAHYLVIGEPSTRFDTIVVWAPSGFDDDEVDAVASIRELYSSVRGFRRCRVACEGWGDLAHVAPEICGSSTTWSTLGPFAAPEHVKPNRTVEQHVERYVRRSLRERFGEGDPRQAPTSIEITSARGVRSHRPNGDSINRARPVRHVKLTYGESVEGPISIGPLSHFGMGLFRPTKDTPVTK